MYNKLNHFTFSIENIYICSGNKAKCLEWLNRSDIFKKKFLKAIS